MTILRQTMMTVTDYNVRTDKTVSLPITCELFRDDELIAISGTNRQTSDSAQRLGATKDAQFLQKHLCKYCADSLRRGGHLVKRADPGKDSTIHTCDICKARVFCTDNYISVDKLLRNKPKGDNK